MPLRLARGSSVETIVGTPAGVTARTATAAGWPPRKIVALPGPWIVHRFSVGAFAAEALAGARRLSARRGACRRFALLFRRRDRALDARLDDARIAAHHQNRIFRDVQRLRIGGLEVDDQRRPAGVGRRVDPGVDAARRHGGDGLVAAPVESGGEAAVHLGSGDDRRREGEHRHAEAERVGVALGHAGRGRRETRMASTSRSSRARWAAQSACVPGSPWSLASESASEEAGRWLDLRVAIEPGQDVARRRPAQAHERRKGDAGADREQDDAGDANGARRELPGARP